MAEFGFPEELISLTRLTLMNPKNKLRLLRYIEQASSDPLAPLEFNIALEKAIRSNTMYRKSSQLLGYTDDVDLTGRSIDIVSEEFSKLSKATEDKSLEANEGKTKYMIVSS